MRRFRRPFRKESRFSDIKFEVKSEVAREIWAVTYLAVAVLTLLSLTNKLGIFGEFWRAVLQPIFGWGIYVVPLAFGALAFVLFFDRTISFGLTKVTGISLLTISLLGIVHLSVPEYDIYTVAKAGQFGGYVGFVSSFIFRTIVGITGAYVVFIALFLISLLLTFEASLRELFTMLKPEIRWVSSEDGAGEEPRIIKPEREARSIRHHSAESAKPQAEKEISPEKPAEKPFIKVRRVAEKAEDKEFMEKISAEEKKGHKQITEWEFPTLDLLADPKMKDDIVSDGFLKEKAESIRTKLAEFGIDVSMHDIHVGPTVIQFTLKPATGVKLAKIRALKADLALALAAKAIRMECPIPGRSLVGIEVPNDIRNIVYLKEVLISKVWAQARKKSKLCLAIGQDVSGRVVVGDLTKMPHLLVAGATGSGKSVGMNSFLASLLYQNSPRDLRMILIDPKRVELSYYNGMPHLLTPVIVDPEKSATALRWAVAEMDRRYKLFSDTGHRNIADYNADAEEKDLLPRIIVVIDELADLMMVAGKEVEASICRIAQMARAVGLHLIIATQRPSVDVITGLIKANISCRIAYTVTSGVDSRTILDMIGAEDLLGEGDMLYVTSDMSKPIRVQGVFISTQEVERITDRVKLTFEPDYDEAITSKKDVAQMRPQGLPPVSGSSSFGTGENSSDDDLMEASIRVIMEQRRVSASLLQRRLKLGYARAARVLDMLEEQGLIGPVQGAKPRDIFFDAIAARSGGEIPAAVVAVQEEVSEEENEEEVV